jgi:site-specific DNA recombinase
MKAALYARVSTNEQRKESIDDQLRECRELCKRHDFSVIDEFSDRGRSGDEVNRSGYQRLLRAVRHREYDVIVAQTGARSSISVSMEQNCTAEVTAENWPSSTLRSA